MMRITDVDGETFFIHPEERSTVIRIRAWSDDPQTQPDGTKYLVMVYRSEMKLLELIITANEATRVIDELEGEY